MPSKTNIAKIMPALDAETQSADTVNSIVRSFAVLNALNASNGSTVAQIAAVSELPRATAHRILETLKVLGYVERGDENGAFFLTANVLQLSKGFAGQSWVDTDAKPLVANLGRELLWPVSLNLPREGTMVMRLGSDFESPMIETRIHTGRLLPLLGTASGYAYLAMSTPAVRETLIAACMKEPAEKMRGTAAELTAFHAALPTILAKGYSYFSAYVYNKGLKRTAAIAVPIISQDNVVGCLSMRFFTSVLNRKKLEDKFVPIFKDAARSLEAKVG